MCELAGELNHGLIIAEPVTKRFTDEVILLLWTEDWQKAIEVALTS